MHETGQLSMIQKNKIPLIVFTSQSAVFTVQNACPLVSLPSPGTSVRYFLFHFSSRLCHISLRRPFHPITRSRIAIFLIPCIFSSNISFSQAFSVLFELLLLCIFIIAPENQIAIVFSYFFLFFRNIFCCILLFLVVSEIFSAPLFFTTLHTTYSVCHLNTIEYSYFE